MSPNESNPQNPNDPKNPQGNPPAGQPGSDKIWKPAFEAASDAVSESADQFDAQGRRIVDEGSYEMLWDCKYCGTKKLLGITHKFCASCGAKQDPNARYFPSDEEAIALKDHVFQGADKICPGCQQPNAAKAEFCTQCGSPLSKAKEATARREQESATAFAGETARTAKDEFQQIKAGIQPAGNEPPPAPKKKWPYIVGGVAALGLITLVAGFFMKRTVEVRIDAHRWEKEIKIEKYAYGTESSWCESTPFDARMVVRKREVRETKQVADGETCVNARVDKGDGSFKKEKRCTKKYRSEPVYGEKCYYQVARWRNSTPLLSAGEGASSPQTWPAVNIRTGNCIGCEREAGREERFILKMTDIKKADKKYDCAYKDMTKWSAMPDQSVRKLQVRAIGGASCDSLQ